MYSTSLVVRTLGFAGLIPFVAPAVLMLGGSKYANKAYDIAQLYALAIICFLCGTWWGFSLGNHRQYPIILSNACLLLACFVFVLAPGWWPLAAPLILLGICVIELNQAIFPQLTFSYRRLRAVLTLIATSAMLLALLLQKIS